MASDDRPCPDASGEGGEPDALERAVRRTEGIQPWRRVFHAGNAVAFVLLYRFVLPGREGAAVLLASLLLVALLVDVARLASPRANVRFFRLFRPLASPREATRIASSTWYLVGILASVLLFPVDAASAGVLVLGLGDPAGSVVGRLRGRHRFGRHSVEGTAGFVAVAFVASLPLLGPARGAAAAVAGAATEAATGLLPRWIDDNLTIPLGAAAGAWASGLIL